MNSLKYMNDDSLYKQRSTLKLSQQSSEIKQQKQIQNSQHEESIHQVQSQFAQRYFQQLAKYQNLDDSLLQYIQRLVVSQIVPYKAVVTIIKNKKDEDNKFIKVTNFKTFLDNKIAQFNFVINQNYQFILRIYISNQYSSVHEAQIIGKGSYGSVYKALFMQQPVAVKCIQFQSQTGFRQQNYRNKIKNVLVQCCLMKIFSILRCGPSFKNQFGFDVIIYKNCIQFCCQLCQDRHQFTKKDAQMLKTDLKKFHSLNIVHRDIKPSNILYSPTFKKWVFCDFGFSQFLNERPGTKSLARFLGTLSYIPAQIKQAFDYNSSKNKKFIDLYYSDLYAVNQSIRKMLTDQKYGSNNQKDLFSSDYLPQEFQEVFKKLEKQQQFYFSLDNSHSIIYLSYLLQRNDFYLLRKPKSLKILRFCIQSFENWLLQLVKSFQISERNQLFIQQIIQQTQEYTEYNVCKNNFENRIQQEKNKKFEAKICKIIAQFDQAQLMSDNEYEDTILNNKKIEQMMKQLQKSSQKDRKLTYTLLIDAIWKNVNFNISSKAILCRNFNNFFQVQKQEGQIKKNQEHQIRELNKQINMQKNYESDKQYSEQILEIKKSLDFIYHQEKQQKYIQQKKNKVNAKDDQLLQKIAFLYLFIVGQKRIFGEILLQVETYKKRPKFVQSFTQFCLLVIDNNLTDVLMLDDCASNASYLEYDLYENNGRVYLTQNSNYPLTTTIQNKKQNLALNNYQYAKLHFRQALSKYGQNLQLLFKKIDILQRPQQLSCTLQYQFYLIIYQLRRLLTLLSKNMLGNLLQQLNSYHLKKYASLLTENFYNFFKYFFLHESAINCLDFNTLEKHLIDQKRLIQSDYIFRKRRNKYILFLDVYKNHSIDSQQQIKKLKSMLQFFNTNNYDQINRLQLLLNIFIKARIFSKVKIVMQFMQSIIEQSQQQSKRKQMNKQSQVNCYMIQYSLALTKRTIQQVFKPEEYLKYFPINSKQLIEQLLNSQIQETLVYFRKGLLFMKQNRYNESLNQFYKIVQRKYVKQQDGSHCLHTYMFIGFILLLNTDKSIRSKGFQYIRFYFKQIIDSSVLVLYFKNVFCTIVQKTFLQGQPADIALLIKVFSKEISLPNKKCLTSNDSSMIQMILYCVKTTSVESLKETFQLLTRQKLLTSNKSSSVIGILSSIILEHFFQQIKENQTLFCCSKIAMSFHYQKKHQVQYALIYYLSIFIKLTITQRKKYTIQKQLRKLVWLNQDNLSKRQLLASIRTLRKNIYKKIEFQKSYFKRCLMQKQLKILAKSIKKQN